MMEIRQKQFLGSDGIRLIADVAGPEGAPAVILAHGGGQTRHSWHNAMRRLAEEGYHVVNYDARGHGDSDWSPDGLYSLDIFASDVRAIARVVGAPVSLVGASMGGMAAFLAIGSSEKPMAQSLVLVDIVLRPALPGVQHILRFMNAHKDGFATLEDAADAVAAYNPDRPRPKNIVGLMKNLRLGADGRLYWHWDPRMVIAEPKIEPPEATQQMVAVAANVKLPTLLIRGLQSDVATDEAVEHMRQIVPHMECHDIPSAGHMVVGDRNDAFNESVVAFLRTTLPLTGRRC